MKGHHSLLVTLFLVAFAHLPIYGQNKHVVDSLKDRLFRSNDTQKINILTELTYQFVDNDNLLALSQIRKANSLSFKIGDSSKIVQTGRIKGQIYNRIGLADSAIYIFNYLLPVAKRNSYDDDRNKITNSLALAYAYNSDYVNALKYNLETLLFRETTHDTVAISGSLQNIGYTYYRLNAVGIALKYFKKALALKLKTHDEQDIPNLLMSIGQCEMNLENYAVAFQNINRARKLCATGCNRKVEIQIAIAMGTYFTKTRNIDSAEQYFKKSRQLSLDRQQLRYQLESSVSLASLYVEFNKPNLAYAYLRESEELSVKTSNTDMLSTTFSVWAKYYREISDEKLTLYYQAKLIRLNDSIELKRTSNLIEVIKELEQQEDARIISNQIEVLQLKDKVILNHRLLIVAISLAAILFLCVSAMLYRLYKKKQSINVILDRRVQERTRALNSNFWALKRYIEEEDIITEGALREWNANMKSLRGLHNLILMDPNYCNESKFMSVTTSRLDEIVERVKTRYQSARTKSVSEKIFKDAL